MSARPFSTESLSERIVKGAPDECWRWTGQHNERGYARIMAHGKPRRYLRITHIMLEESGFPQPVGGQALHSCDNPWCINPAHLRWGTQKENGADMRDRKRAFRPCGVKSYNAKLNDEIVRAIRRSGETATWWAKRLGISLSTICKIRAGKAWAHVD